MFSNFIAFQITFLLALLIVHCDGLLYSNQSAIRFALTFGNPYDRDYFVNTTKGQINSVRLDDWRRHVIVDSTASNTSCVIHFNDTIAVSKRMRQEKEFRQRLSTDLQTNYAILSSTVVSSSLPATTPIAAINKLTYPSDGNSLPSSVDVNKTVMAVSFTFLAEYYYTVFGNGTKNASLVPWYSVGPDVSDFTQRLSRLLFGDASSLASRASLQYVNPSIGMPLQVPVYASNMSSTTVAPHTTSMLSSTSATTSPFTTSSANVTQLTTTPNVTNISNLTLPNETSSTTPTSTTTSTTSTTTTTTTTTSTITTTTTFTPTTTTTEGTTDENYTETSSSMTPTVSGTSPSTTPTTTSAPSPIIAYYDTIPTVVSTIVFYSDETVHAQLTSGMPRLQELYALFTDSVSTNVIQDQLPGCVKLSIYTPGGGGVASSNGKVFSYSTFENYYSSEQRKKEGHDEYMKSKVGFLAALIVILVVSVAGAIAGHFYSLKSQDEMWERQAVSEQYMRGMGGRS